MQNVEKTNHSELHSTNKGMQQADVTSANRVLANARYLALILEKFQSETFYTAEANEYCVSLQGKYSMQNFAQVVRSELVEFTGEVQVGDCTHIKFNSVDHVTTNTPRIHIVLMREKDQPVTL